MAAFWVPKQVDTVRRTLQSLKETRDIFEDSVWINAAIWASMATITPLCKEGQRMGGVVIHGFYQDDQ